MTVGTSAPSVKGGGVLTGAFRRCKCA